MLLQSVMPATSGDITHSMVKMASHSQVQQALQDKVGGVAGKCGKTGGEHGGWSQWSSLKHSYHCVYVFICV